MARKRLKGGPKGLPAPKLTRAQQKILRKFSTNAKDLARRLRAEARKEKSGYVAANRPTLDSHKRGALTKKTGLNTWIKEESKAKARLSVEYIKRGKHKGKFKDQKTGKIVTRATVNRRASAYKYHASVRHIQKVLNGSYKQARKAYKAFLVAGVLRAIEFES